MPPPTSCPTATGGPTLVPICGGYCIDSTEVTGAQYAAWLATNPSPASLPYYCSWKSTYNSGTGTQDYPVGSVDWCDAYGFCLGVGKRLCGKIGGGALPNFYYDAPTRSQW